jgi:Protein of unknown function (DUF3631)/CHC2 zinc finger
MYFHNNDWTDRARAVRIEDELARRGVTLRGRGTDRCGPCPVCGGDDRFSINVDKQVFNCRGCGVGGDVIALVQHLDGAEFNGAVTALAGPKPNGGAKKQSAKSITAASYEYCAADGTVLYAIDRIEYQNTDGTFVLKEGKRKKTFSQRRPDGDGGWVRNVDGITRVPYQLPELIEAVALEHPIFIVEGEACVEALRAIGIAATTNSGGAGKWLPEFNEHLRGADVLLLPDNDEPGWRHVNDIAAGMAGIARSVRILALPDLSEKGDCRDWLAAGGTREQLDALAEAAPSWQPPAEVKPTDEAKTRAEADEKELIAELARLNGIDYDRQRREAAKQLGIRPGTLDDQVEARRAELADQEGPPPLFGHWVVEPWADPVDTGELIADLAERIKRHVVLQDHEATTVALWILFAWAHDVAVHSPMLLATSPEAGSGKTTLVSLVGFLVPRGLMTTGISEAALFRSIEKWQPTIAIDEADVLLVENEPLRAVVNSGWTRGQGVLRCVGDDKVPHLFPTFAPKAIAMKGRNLPDTTLSRSIVIEMKRKRAGERAEFFPCIDDAGLAELRSRAMRWATDSIDKLVGATPVMPPGFDNRLGANWTVMLSIAELAGGEWPELARDAAVKLNLDDPASIGVQLLAAIRSIFDGETELQSLDRIGSAELVAQLVADAGSPWAEWKNGKPITQAQLARALKRWGVHPEKIRFQSGGALQGYQRHQFADAWERYLPAGFGQNTRNTGTNAVYKG